MYCPSRMQRLLFALVEGEHKAAFALGDPELWLVCTPDDS